MPDPALERELILSATTSALYAWAMNALGADGLQVWVSDDLGFHPRDLLGRPFDDDDRAMARRSCIEGAVIVSEDRLAVPVELSDRRSGACLFSLARPCDAAASEAARLQVRAAQAALDEGLLLQRLSRLSGSARQSDRLRALLALAHTLEHCADKRSVLGEVQRLLCGLLHAENFFVVVLDDTSSLLEFEHFVDQFDRDESPIPFIRGSLEGSLSAFVVAAGRVVRGSSEELLAQAGHGDRLDDHRFGPRAHDWLGVPMIAANDVMGAVVIQSYDPAIRFDDGDPSILSMLAEALGAALHRRRVREALERQVRERTAQLEAAKQAAEQALAELQSAQAQLVQAEKMASLGQLVAGVAHEANTPLGVALTANSHLLQQVQELRTACAAGQLHPAGLGDFLSSAVEAADMVSRNLDRATRLIQNFKQVSVDRTSDGRRRFLLDAFLDELIGSIASLWRQRAVTVTIACEPDIALDSFPGALGQVLTNLVSNALLHAFAGGEPGTIRMECRRRRDGQVELDFIDDGCGIDPRHLRQVFEPFFTTKRNQGGTGLGLHIAYNLVTQKLGGSIGVASQPGVGTRFEICLPVIAPT